MPLQSTQLAREDAMEPPLQIQLVEQVLLFIPGAPHLYKRQSGLPIYVAEPIRWKLQIRTVVRILNLSLLPIRLQYLQAVRWLLPTVAFVTER